MHCLYFFHYWWRLNLWFKLKFSWNFLSSYFDLFQHYSYSLWEMMLTIFELMQWNLIWNSMDRNYLNNYFVYWKALSDLKLFILTIFLSIALSYKISLIFFRVVAFLFENFINSWYILSFLYLFPYLWMCFHLSWKRKKYIVKLNYGFVLAVLEVFLSVTYF